ncbi:MAG: squalene/phytoene synthase family protein [Sumerlaeia bacterium]
MPLSSPDPPPPIASALGRLPKPQRQDVRGLLAFAHEIRHQFHTAHRASGGAFADIQATAHARLAEAFADPAATPEPFRTAAAIAARHAIPRLRLTMLMDGLGAEVFRRSVRDWRQLEGQLQQTGGTLALLLAQVLGADPAAARGPALAGGNGVRLAQLLTSVPADLERGVIALPLDDLANFGVEESIFTTRQPTPALRDLVAFEAERARKLLTQGEAGAALLAPGPPRNLLKATTGYYHGRLDALEANGWDVFGEVPEAGGRRGFGGRLVSRLLSKGN